MSTGYDTEFEAPVEKDSASFDVDRPTSKLAATSLAFGILGVTALPLYGSIVAVATGHAAMGEIRESEGRLGGKSLAKIGLWLGYFSLILALVALLIFGIILCFATPWAINYERQEATRVETPAPAPMPLPAPSVPNPAEHRGVKMVNQMARQDFQLIERTEAGVKDAEIIAYYNAGKSESDPEFALLTTDRLVYLNDGRRTVFELKDVAGLKDDKSFEQAYHQVILAGGDGIYHIEVRNKQGIRMRIDIQPPQDGSLFFDALKSALQAAGTTLPPGSGS